MLSYFIKKYKKAFSLLEVVVAISIITLCILALLSTYYSILDLQNKVMYTDLLKRKFQTILFTKVNLNTLTDYQVIIDLLKDDEVGKLVDIESITVSSKTDKMQIEKVIPNVERSQKISRYVYFEIKGIIIKTKRSFNLQIVIPVVVGIKQNLSSSGTGRGPGSTTTAPTSIAAEF